MTPRTQTRPLDDPRMWRKRLVAIGHARGTNAAQRSGWYRCVEGIPLSDRHAGHILAHLKRRAA